MMKKLYKDSIRPVEELYKFDLFNSPLLEDGDVRNTRFFFI